MMNKSTMLSMQTQPSITISNSLDSRRVSVIKWTGKELHFKKLPNDTSCLSVVPDLSIANKESTLSPSDSIVKKRTKGEKYHCQFCGKSFKWLSHWKAHERIHTGERPYKCEICGKAFARSDGLQSHRVNHMKQNGSWLAINDRDRQQVRKGSSRLLLANHASLSNHVEEESVRITTEPTRVFHCYICNRVFSTSVGLVSSVAWLESFRLLLDSTSVGHLNTHKGRPNNKCEVCNMMFTKRSALEIHSRVHTGLKPHSCHICTKAFSIHGNLKRHLLTHSGEKPYKCLKCSNCCFNSHSHLKRHLRTKHNFNDDLCKF